jgi:glycosyltransferase involved in cell wall biosynthesis
MIAAPAPRVSLCLPTYQRAELLELCIRSILSQTYSDFELVVVDNASSDETPAVVHRFADARIRFYRNDQNIGPFPNMNRAISLARGELICVAHDDDLYLPQFLERETAFMDAHPSVGMVHSAVYEIESSGRRRRIVRAYSSSRVLDGRAAFVRFLRGHNVCCSSVMVRRRLYEIAGTFDPRFRTADFHLWLRLAMHGDVGYLAEPLVEMRVHPERGTSRMTPERWYEEFVQIVDEGLGLAARGQPPLRLNERSVRRAAADEQGRRFLIATMSAAGHDDVASARGYASVVSRFRAIGLPWPYAFAARLSITRVGRRILKAAIPIRERLLSRGG